MEIAIKKVAERDGDERFVLVNPTTREVLTVHDVSASTLRRFFQQRGASEALFDECIERARASYQDRSQHAAAAVSEASDTIEDDELLFDLGLGDNDADVH